MVEKLFTRTGTALITPFCGEKGKEIEWTALADLIESQVGDRADFLVPCGTTGESPTLSHLEQKEVIKFVVEQTAGRIPVLAGTGSNSTDEALELTEAAKRLGANGALVVTPYYNKPTQNGMKEYYREIAQIGLPVILYDIPGRCGGQGASAQTILELAREGSIHGLKWASGNLDQLMDVLAGRPESFSVLSGDDNLTFTAMCLGADGVISVMSNIIPNETAYFVTLLLNGELELARRQHFRLLKFMRAMFIETNPIPVKTAWRLIKEKYEVKFRSPLCELEAGNLSKLAEVLYECRLLK